MSKKKRTKKQKIIARLRRQIKQQESIVEKAPPQVSAKKKVKKIQSFKEVKKDKLFTYPSELIKKELVKTIILSLVFLALILLLKYFPFFKNNLSIYNYF